MKPVACALAIGLALGAVLAQEAGDPLGEARARLEATEFEQALSALDALLGRENLDPKTRLEARVLRAQALVALGDTKRAETEWAAILDERPGFRPDPAVVPAKAMKRFEALRASKVGTVRLDLDPEDAALSLDGSPVERDPDGALSVLAGTHTLRAERSGFDPAETTLAVGAGGALDLSLRLSPNARTVVVEVEPAGTEVVLDGRPAGRAEVPAEGGRPVLVLPDLPLGDHTFELRLACHRTVRVDELLAVDLLDRAPRRLGPYRMESARGRLSPTGLDGATLSLDGTEQGVLPLPAFEACAGPRQVTVLRSGRRIWSGTVDVPDGEEAKVVLSARPNLAVLGGSPPSWSEAWSVETPDLPAGADPAAQEWPTYVDLVWTPEGAWSPWLQDTVTLLDDPLLQAPPARARGTIGVALADAEPWGTARIVRLREDGPAARAGVRLGERIAAVGGKPVRSAADAEAAIAGAGDRPLELSLEGIPGEMRKVSVSPVRSPVLPPPPADRAQAALRAAWAAADAAAQPNAIAAEADLALALAAAGRTEAAIERWRAVKWSDRSGVGEGTAAYFLGRALQAVGHEAEGARALAQAAASQATAESDDGPPVAPAAQSP